MKWLQNRAMRVEANRLRPFMRADEHFLEADMANVTLIVHEDHMRAPRRRTAIAITSHAVYLRDVPSTDGTVFRIPYERVINLLSVRGMIELVTPIHSYIIEQIGHAMGGDKYELIAAGMRRVERYRQVVEVPGGKVLAANRPFDEGEPGQWVLTPSQGVSLDDSAVRAALERELAPAVVQLGPLFPAD